jgi:integrase
MWGAADITLKTYMALALNCGFKAGDISHLTAANVQGDYISCNRNKTGVPMRYKLWSITKELLKEHTPGETTFFQTAEGERLVTVDVNGGANGKGQRKSKVDNKFAILRRKVKIKGFSFDNFRDTSTTWIEAHDPAVSDMFDAHADNRMARFYVDRSRLDLDKLYAPLDRATDALEKHYDLKIDTPQKSILTDATPIPPG